MRPSAWIALAGLPLLAAGCPQSPPTPPPPVAPAAVSAAESPSSASDRDTDDSADAEEEAVVGHLEETDTENPPEPAEEADAPSELQLEGIRFVVPAGWKKVKPPNHIIEAEFALPRAEGDEHDGRLTLMASGGDPQETIANRTAEFNREPGDEPHVEELAIDGSPATWVDLRGEWKGQLFDRGFEPRPGYRMLLVIIPFTERSAFYAKLTGPQATIARHEEEFRAFVHTARRQALQVE